jgi:hypothetical protein
METGMRIFLEWQKFREKGIVLKSSYYNGKIF